MARPVKPRGSKAYRRDIQTLTRLRTALILDKTASESDAREAIRCIDELTETLVKLMPHDEVM